MKVSRIGISGIALVSLIGCSSLGFDNKRVDYRSGAVQAPSLEVPPDLTTPTSDDRYRVPQGEGESVSTFSDYSKGGATTDPGRAGQSRGAGAVLPEVKGARLERSGTQRWLVVSDKPEHVWTVLKAFLQENGLGIKSEDQTVGVIETEWVENRAAIPEDGLRKLISKVKIFDSLYSSGERDQYRLRLERSAEKLLAGHPKDGASTEVYITHRGMEEMVPADGGVSRWQARPTDPELEAIMLQRLLARFGGDAKTTGKAGATGGATPASAPAAGSSAPNGTARLEEIFDGSKIIVLNDVYDRSWRRVGLAVERAGLTVEDKDRNRGVYLLSPGKAEKGWLSKLKFWESDEDTDRRYRVNVKDGGTMCEVSVTDQDGANDDATKQMIEAIYKNINQ
ncbi:MAG: outer membrane protein assembly factor BamC [Sideroxyarcus sp.]|nr:outer membrane protein assembly factor BamC [Sideroxyarcus sp.]